jgi:hypothetical protein
VKCLRKNRGFGCFRWLGDGCLVFSHGQNYRLTPLQTLWGETLPCRVRPCSKISARRICAMFKNVYCQPPPSAL